MATRFGAYEILYELKTGGMGAVLLGRRRGPGARFRDLRLWLDPNEAQPQLAEVVDTALPFKEAKERWNDHFERRYVAMVFASNANNVTRAAEHAGLSRRHFRELLYKHGIVERPADDGESPD